MKPKVLSFLLGALGCGTACLYAQPTPLPPQIGGPIQVPDSPKIELEKAIRSGNLAKVRALVELEGNSNRVPELEKDSELAGLMMVAIREAEFKGTEPLQWLIRRAKKMPNAFRCGPDPAAGAFPILNLLSCNHFGKNNLVETLEILLAAGADPEEGRPLRTPLAMAVAKGYSQVAMALLAAGADVNAAGGAEPLSIFIWNHGSHDWAYPWNEYKGTPLHYAVRKKHFDLAALLLKQPQVRADILDSYGMTAFDLAQAAGNNELLELFSRSSFPSSRVTPFDSAVRKGMGWKKPLKFLRYPPGRIDLGCELLRNSSLLTPEILKEIEDHGWPVRDTVNRSKFLAKELIRPTFAPWLIEHSIRLEPILSGFQPLNALAIKTQADVEALMTLGCDLNFADDQELTPLMWHASYGNLMAIQALLAKGADPNLRTSQGISALDLAHRRLWKLDIQSNNGNSSKNKKGESGDFFNWLHQGGYVAPILVMAIAVPQTPFLLVDSLFQKNKDRKELKQSLESCKRVIELLSTAMKPVA